LDLWQGSSAFIRGDKQVGSILPTHLNPYREILIDLPIELPLAQPMILFNLPDYQEALSTELDAIV
jgi:hypothetical protein